MHAAGIQESMHHACIDMRHACVHVGLQNSCGYAYACMQACIN